jgi:hypothetical protein
MGFESRVTGYIATSTNSTLDRDKLLDAVRKRINELPKLCEDKSPFLPREIFDISITDSGTNPIPITYRSIIIHFGMSVKQLESELEEWLNKYETFMKSIPGVWESLVNVRLEPYTEAFDYEHMTYWWCKEFLPKSSETIWKYKGGPRNWDELVKSKN